MVEVPRARRTKSPALFRTLCSTEYVGRYSKVEAKLADHVNYLKALGPT